MENINQTIISQFGSAPTLTQLIYNINGYIDPQANLAQFYSLVFNVATAVGSGLDVWGRIVNVGRTVQIAGTIAYFGFQQAGASTFGQEAFYNGTSPTTTNYTLSDDAYRTVIYAKGLANICDGSIPAVNQILINLFGSTYGNAYVADNGGMSETYTFGSTLSAVDRAVISQLGVLPRSCGVAANIVD